MSQSPAVEARQWFRANADGFLVKGELFGAPAAIVERIRKAIDPFGWLKTCRTFVVHGHDRRSLRLLKRHLQHTLGLPAPTVLGEIASEGRTITELRSKLASLAERGAEHAQRLAAHFAFVYGIAKSNTIEDFVRNMSLAWPGVEVVVTDDARMVANPTDALLPTMWMLVDSQRRHETERADHDVMAVIKVDIDDRNYCRVVVGPDTRERSNEWKDVTEEACKAHWMGAAAAALRAAGIETRVRSNGPLAEVTMRWPRAE